MLLADEVGRRNLAAEMIGQSKLGCFASYGDHGAEYRLGGGPMQRPRNKNAADLQRMETVSPRATSPSFPLASFFYWGWFGNLFIDAHDFLRVVDVFLKRGLEAHNELGAIG